MVYQEDAWQTLSLEQPETSTKEDPLQKLRQFKEMLDADLITNDEYEAKKAEVLSRMWFFDVYW